MRGLGPAGDVPEVAGSVMGLRLGGVGSGVVSVRHVYIVTLVSGSLVH